jgi:hypothetical protein
MQIRSRMFSPNPKQRLIKVARLNYHLLELICVKSIAEDLNKVTNFLCYPEKYIEMDNLINLHLFPWSWIVLIHNTS